MGRLIFPALQVLFGGYPGVSFKDIGPISVSKISKFCTPNFYFIFESVRKFQVERKKKFYSHIGKNFFHGDFSEINQLPRGDPWQQKISKNFEKKKKFLFFFIFTTWDAGQTRRSGTSIITTLQDCSHLPGKWIEVLYSS